MSGLSADSSAIASVQIFVDTMRPPFWGRMSSDSTIALANTKWRIDDPAAARRVHTANRMVSPMVPFANVASTATVAVIAPGANAFTAAACAHETSGASMIA